MNENRDDFYTQERFGEQSSAAHSIGAYTAKTFAWMLAGLLTTFLVALGVISSRTVLLLLFSIPYFQIVLLVAEVAVVLVLSTRITKMAVSTAKILFFLYAALNGVFFSVYLFIFELPSLLLVFAATAIYFGALAAYGYFTKTDLSRLRPILIGGLLFLLVVGVLSLFLPLGAMERIFCLVGIAVFLGFTAYDTQKIRAYHAAYANNPEMAQKASIYAALALYLDFINLFLYLLRFLGRRK